MTVRCSVEETYEENMPEVVVKQCKCDKVRDKKEKTRLHMERHCTLQTQSTPGILR